MSELIMVFDDNQALLELYQDILSEEGGYQVSTHISIPTNLGLVKELKPALLIIDLLFGQEKSGWDFIQMLKKDCATASIPIILCSGNTVRVSKLEEHLKAKHVLTLLKPFDVDELLEKVKLALGGFSDPGEFAIAVEGLS